MNGRPFPALLWAFLVGWALGVVMVLLAVWDFVWLRLVHRHANRDSP